MDRKTGYQAMAQAMTQCISTYEYERLVSDYVKLQHRYMLLLDMFNALVEDMQETKGVSDERN